MDGCIPNESSESREFNKSSAATCVRSARKIIHLVVNEPNPSNSPWWCLLHYLMPAKGIIMLEMIHQAIHTPEHKAALFADGKMVLNWLKGVAKANTSLQRYIVELEDQLKKVAPRMGEYFEEDEPNNVTIPFVGHAPVPFQSGSDTDGGVLSFGMLGKPRDNEQEQYFGTASPAPAWWPPTQGDSDQMMADVEQVDPYAYLSYPQAGVSSRFTAGNGER